MAAPKPWESSIPMSSQPMPTTFDTMNIGLMPTVEQQYASIFIKKFAFCHSKSCLFLFENYRRIQTPAPLPPPRTIQQQQQQMGFYPSSSYMSPYGLNPYQAGGFYNNYRLSPYGTASNLPVGNFAQLAMDESRSAFSSIESVIHTFRSISFMLESTFTSVYSSFRAVTDVFDHFTRVRAEISTIYPLVLIWRFLKYLYHRLLRLLHLRQATHGSSEETWTAIYNSLQQNAANANGTGAPRSSSSSLLVALFFVVSFGTPMLMLKLINSIIKKRQGTNT